MKKIAAIAAFLLAGCAASGNQVKQEQLGEFKEGITTMEQVLGKLGTPTTTMRNFDGSQTIIYSYVHTQVRPTTFIPIVGALAGGADSRANMAMFRFGPDGKLMQMSASESNYGSGTGLAAGKPIPQTDQPKQSNQ